MAGAPGLRSSHSGVRGAHLLLHVPLRLRALGGILFFFVRMCLRWQKRKPPQFTMPMVHEGQCTPQTPQGELRWHEPQPSLSAGISWMLGCHHWVTRRGMRASPRIIILTASTRHGVVLWAYDARVLRSQSCAEINGLAHKGLGPGLAALAPRSFRSLIE